MTPLLNRRRVLVVVGVLLVVFILLLNYRDYLFSSKEPTDFETCAAWGNPVMESYPRRCRFEDKTFVENIGNTLEKDDLIRVIEPQPNETLPSQFSVIGTARGFWFFEASFPVEVLSESGTRIGGGIAEALDEWMTEEFVSFRAKVSVDPKYEGDATLVLIKDNPSGLPEHADELSFPIEIEKGASAGPYPPPSGSGTTSPESGACIVTGCSRQICSDEEVVTTCEYRAEYGCYRNAVCERQINGECGWSQTEELRLCLGTPPGQ